MHPSGHQTVGGLMVDQFASSSDPAFYLHHAQVDRMWSIWQSLDPSVRQNQLQGSTTWFNSKFPRNDLPPWRSVCVGGCEIANGLALKFPLHRTSPPSSRSGCGLRRRRERPWTLPTRWRTSSAIFTIERGFYSFIHFFLSSLVLF